MSELLETRLKLDVPAWMDNPQDVIESLLQAGNTDIVIDASTDIPPGAQIIQLLLSATKTAEQLGQKLFVENASTEFRQTLENLGLAEAIAEKNE